MSIAWEQLDNRLKGVGTGIAKMYRTKVPNGWLVLIVGEHDDSITFIPDAEHVWNGGTLD